MLFQAWWLSIPRFQHLSFLPAPTQLLSLRPQLAFSPQRSLFPHNPRSISPSLPFLKSVFWVVSPPPATFWIASCATLQELGPFLLPSNTCLHSFDDIVVWNALSICHICLPVMAKGFFSEHWPLYFVLTLLLDEMLNVARYGPHRGKLRLLCFGWCASSTWTQQNLRFAVTELGIAMVTVHHLVSGSCKIHGMSWDNHQQTSFPSKNVLCISHKPDIPAVLHRDLSP